MLDELQWFLLVVEKKSFTAAARSAHLSQPALSAAMRRLEDQLGAQLLHRGRNGAEPSEAGRALIPRARAALAAVEDGRRAVAEVMGLGAGEVRIGGGATACTYLLPALLTEFRRRHPAIHFRVKEAFPDALREAVDAGEIDLAVVSGEGNDAWGQDSLILIGPPKPAGNFDAQRGPFIAFPPGSSTRAILDQQFPRAEVVMELAGIAAVKGNVRAGAGLALVSSSAVKSDLESGRLRRIQSPQTPLVRQLSLIHRGVERLPPAAGALRSLLLEGRPFRSRRSRSRPSR